MPLSPGHRIGPYEITAQLGAGGMGEVYRATDTMLGRQVALKVLPPAFANDAERMARFRREAQTLAALNHPNIASIYGIEGNAIVMELVEGKDLAGPLPLDEALPIARQIAEALEAAHEKGIIHRDLKPANVKVTPQGVVKLLDFGLAKAITEDPADQSNSPTLSIAMTSAGMILGTAAYMSPEQAKGKTVDRRADIWAFGIVLLETLTGRRTYSGETVAETLAAVIKDSPPLTDVPAATPPFLRTLLARCLEKEPRRRLRDIGEARVAIEDYLANPAATNPEAPARQRPVWPYAAAAAFVALLSGGLLYWQWRTPPPEAPVVRFHVLPPDGFRHSINNNHVSPDGKHLAISPLKGSGQRQIWLRDLDSTTMTVLEGTESGVALAWSPDSHALLFAAGEKLKRVDVGGRQVQTLCDWPASVIGRGATWGAGGVILLGNRSGPLMRVQDSGGALTPALKLQSANSAGGQIYPQFLPGGVRFLYVDTTAKEPGIYLANLDGKEPPRRVHDSTGRFLFAADAGLKSGYLVFRVQNSLMAVRFDPASGQASGDPVVVLDKPSGNPSTMPVSASTPARVVSMAAGLEDSEDALEMVAMDRSGRTIAKLGGGATGGHLDLSPAGDRLLNEHREGGSGGVPSLWAFDLNRKTSSRITFGPNGQSPGIWSADGRRVLYHGFVGDVEGLCATAADGSGGPEMLLPGGLHHLSASADGQYIAFEPGGNSDVSVRGTEIHVFSLRDGGKPKVAVRGNAPIGNPQFSPDGKWIAFSSRESGRQEVYVQSFAAGGGRWQVSNQGGNTSRWRKDGREIVYYDSNGHIWSASVTPRPGGLDFGVPVKLFDVRVNNQWFVMSGDAQRFYANVAAYQKPEAEAPKPLTVLLNWAPALKK